MPTPLKDMFERERFARRRCQPHTMVLMRHVHGGERRHAELCSARHAAKRHARVSAKRQRVVRCGEV